MRLSTCLWEHVLRAPTILLLGSFALAQTPVRAQAIINVVRLDSSADLYNYDCSFITGSEVNRVYVKLRATDDQDAIQQIKAMHSDAHAVLLTRGTKAK